MNIIFEYRPCLPPPRRFHYSGIAAYCDFLQHGQHLPLISSNPSCYDMKQTNIIIVYIKNLKRGVSAGECLGTGDPEFKSRSDHELNLSQVVLGSIPRLHLYKANWSASCQPWVFLPVQFRHLPYSVASRSKSAHDYQSSTHLSNLYRQKLTIRKSDVSATPCLTYAN